MDGTDGEARAGRSELMLPAHLPAWHVLRNVLYMFAALAADHPISVTARTRWTDFPYPCHDDLIGFWS